MTAEEYRQRMIQALHNADCDELIAVVCLPTEKEFEHLEWLLKTHYKKGLCIEQALNEVSTAQPKQKTYQWGRQILFNDGCGGVKVGYACPACKTYVPNKGNYCSNCGAKFTKR